MEPGDRSFDHPAVATHATAVGSPSPGQVRVDAPVPQGLSTGLGVVGAVGVHAAGPAGRLAVVIQGSGRVDQGQQHRSLRHVGGGVDSGQRQAAGVRFQVLLDPRTPAISRVWAAALDAAEGPREGRIDRRPRPVDPVGVVEVGQEHLVEGEPDPGLLPVAESPPAGHAAAAAHLDGEVLPGDAGLENEEDAGEHLAVVDRFAAGAAKATRLGGRQQRFDEFPQSIRKQWLGHDKTSPGRPPSPRNELRRPCRKAH